MRSFSAITILVLTLSGCGGSATVSSQLADCNSSQLALQVIGLPDTCPNDQSGIEELSLVSDATGQSINFKIYTPPGYECSEMLYPVSFFLHGLMGNPDVIDKAVNSLVAAMSAGVTGPMIIVAPDGYGNTMWGDNYFGDKPAETDSIKQILPYIDANYRTIADRRFRAVQGFSMGGFGAMAWASKYPNLFFAGINYDGALHTWDTLNSTTPTLQAAVPEEFNNDENNFLPYSPYTNATLNAAQIKASVELRSVVGLLDEKNSMFRDLLIELGIWPSNSPQYIDTDCGHNLQCLLGLDVDIPGNAANATGKGNDMWQLLWQLMENSADDYINSQCS